MWPFSPSQDKTDKVDNVKLSSNNQVPQVNVESSAPSSANSKRFTILNQEQPSTYHRLGFHPVNRVQLVAGLAFIVGAGKGITRGAEVAGLCFRAENAHLTPTSKAGWFLYNKSKNYHIALGAAKQGVKTGGVYFGWTAFFLTLEHGLDAARGRLFASRKEKEIGRLAKGQADFLNTISAAVAVAGIYSWWSRMDRFAAARMTRGAVLFSIPFGLGQDLVASLSGQNTWYIEVIAKLLGRGTDRVGEYETPQKSQRLV